MTGEATAKSLSPSRWALAGGAGLVIIAIVLLRTGGGSARPLLAVLGAAGILSCCWGLTTMLRIQRGAVEDAPASESPPLSEEQPAPTIQPPFRADRGPGDTSSGVPAVTTPGPPPLTPKPPANRPPPSPVEAYATPPSPPPSTPPRPEPPAPGTAATAASGLIQFQCHCGQRIAAPVKLAGQVVPCPSCKRPGRIPILPGAERP